METGGKTAEEAKLVEANPQSRESRTKLSVEQKSKLLEIAPDFKIAMPKIHVQDISRRLGYVTDALGDELDGGTVYDDRTVNDCSQMWYHGEDWADHQEHKHKTSPGKSNTGLSFSNSRGRDVPENLRLSSQGDKNANSSEDMCSHFGGHRLDLKGVFRVLPRVIGRPHLDSSASKQVECDAQYIRFVSDCDAISRLHFLTMAELMVVLLCAAFRGRRPCGVRSSDQNAEEQRLLRMIMEFQRPQMTEDSMTKSMRDTVNETTESEEHA